MRWQAGFILWVVMATVAGRADGWVAIGSRGWPRHVLGGGTFFDSNPHRVGLYRLEGGTNEVALYPQTVLWNRFAKDQIVRIPNASPGDVITVRIQIFAGEFWRGASDYFQATAGGPADYMTLTNMGYIYSPLGGGENFSRYLDPLFSPQLPWISGLENLRINALFGQPDGKSVLAGRITPKNGAPRRMLARFQFDGEADASFAPELPEKTEVRFAELQADGKILLAGSFPRADGSTRSLARILTNGAPDESFECLLAEPVTAMLLNATNGTMLIAAGEMTGRLLKYESNGAPALDFAPIEFSGTIHAIAKSETNAYWVGGEFASVNGIETGSLARLNSEGEVELEADWPKVEGPVYAISGRLAGGAFKKVDGRNCEHLVWVDGTNSRCGIEAFVTGHPYGAQIQTNPFPVVRKIISDPAWQTILLVESSTNGGYVLQRIGSVISEIRGDQPIQAVAMHYYPSTNGTINTYRDDLLIAGAFGSASMLERMEIRSGMARYVRHWNLQSTGVNPPLIREGYAHLVPRGYGGDLEFSTDLKTWFPLGPPGGPTGWYFDDAGAARKFYRRRKDW